MSVRSTTVLLLVAVLLFVFTATAMASMSEKRCTKFCERINSAERRERCLARCKELRRIPIRRPQPVRPSPMDDEETVAPVKKSRRRRSRRIGRRIGRWFRKNRCKLCLAGCAMLKDSKKDVCEAACNSFACKNESESLDDAAPAVVAKKQPLRKRLPRKHKCTVCKKLCERVKDEEKQAKCNAVCDKLCSKKSARRFRGFAKKPRRRFPRGWPKKPRSLRQEEAEVQSEAAFRIRSRRLRRIGRIARRAWTIYRGARAIGVLEDDAAPKKRRGLFGKRRRSGRKGKKFPKCRLCFKFCSRVKDEEKRAKCFAFCKSKCSKKRPDEEAEVQSEAALRIRSRRLRRIGRIARRAWRIYRGARAIGLLEDDATPKKRRKLMKFGRKGKKFHKCRVCHKFCARVKDEEKQAKCKAACKRLCSKRRKPKRKSKKVEETLSAKPAWKCPACRLACEMIKNEKKKALCLAACDITACKDE